MSPPQHRRILIATTTPALGAGLERWLDGGRPGWEVVDVCAGLDSLRAQIIEHDASIVVASACLDGFLVMAELDNIGRELPLLVLADQPDPGYEVDLLRAGADGVLSVKATKREMVRAVGDLLDGRTVASTGAVRRLIAAQPQRLDITPRQREILALLARGASTEEIAEALVVTPSTVKTHIGRLATRFGLGGRFDLAREAPRLLAETGVGQTTIVSANGATR